MHHRLQIVLYAKNIQIVMTEFFKIVSFAYKKKMIYKCVETCWLTNVIILYNSVVHAQIIACLQTNFDKTVLKLPLTCS